MSFSLSIIPTLTKDALKKLEIISILNYKFDT